MERGAPVARVRVCCMHLGAVQLCVCRHLQRSFHLQPVGLMRVLLLHKPLPCLSVCRCFHT